MNQVSVMDQVGLVDQMKDSPSGSLSDHWLMISDVDDTVLGDEAALARLADALASQREVTDCGRKRLALVYSSGRFVDSILESVAQHQMPEPDWVVGGVGTQIQAISPWAKAFEAKTIDVLRCDEGSGADGADGGGAGVFAESNALGSIWQSKLSQTYDAQSVVELLCDLEVEAVTGQDDSVACGVGDVKGLLRQPEAYQSELKTSYFTSDLKVVDQVKQRLKQAGLNHRVVYSSRRDLDILPEDATKAGAACYLAKMLGYKKERVICCGDSGNDLAMLTAGFYGVVVANCRPELVGVEDPRVYHASKCFADGVLEGLMYWQGRVAACQC